MRRKLFLSIVILTKVTSGLFAQGHLNKKDTSLVFKYLIGSDLNFTFGNVNSYITVSQAQFDLQHQKVGTKILVRYRYGELESATKYNEFYSDAGLILFPKNRVSGFLNVGAEYSFLRSINLRAWGGLGASFKVANTELHTFEPTVTINYEYSNYAALVLYRGDSTRLVQTVVANLGWTASHKFFKKKLLLLHNFEWVQDMFSPTNYKIDGGFALGVPVIKKLMFKTAIVGSYSNIVPAPKKQFDLIWTIGLSWGNL